MLLNKPKLNGPVIVARSLESIRATIDGIRREIGLAPQHLDSKMHVSICHITGKNAKGERDDQLLRDRIEKPWPLLSNGFFDILPTLPL